MKFIIKKSYSFDQKFKLSEVNNYVEYSDLFVDRLYYCVCLVS